MTIQPTLIKIWTTVALCAWAAGCVTVKSNFRIQISNFSDEPIHQVQVRAADAVIKRVDTVAPNAGITLPELTGDLPEDLIIHWSDDKSNSWTQRVQVRSLLPAGFRGDIQLEIRAGGDMKVYVQGADAQSESAMPWAAPESWEGTPAFPGVQQ